MEATVREKIFPSQSEVFKDELEEIVLVLRNMDAETLQWMTDELIVIYSEKFSDKVPEHSIGKFKDELEEIALVLRKMDAETLQRMIHELMVIYSDKRYQRAA